MKKSLLVTAISAATMISAGAYASPVVAEVTLWWTWSNGDVVSTCPTGAPVSGTGLTVGGTSAASAMSGGLCLDPTFGLGQPLVALDFALTGAAVGTVGTVFDGGTIGIYTHFGTTSGWIAYNTISAASTPIACLISSGVGGITWTGGGTTPAFTGGLLPSGTPACSANLLGSPANLYMQ